MRALVAAIACSVSLFCALPLEASEWTDRERRILASIAFSAPLAPPPSPSNRVADNIKAAEFGRQIFFDKAFGKDGQFSCATCHDPTKYYTDGRPRSVGAGLAMRNSQPLVGVAHNRWFYWDGRRDSLWSQALIPFEAADEMGASRVSVVRRVATVHEYSEQYVVIFGTLPEGIDDSKLPTEAGPYTSGALRAAWQKLPQSRQRAINLVYTNIGKALAAFQRTLAHPATRFDRYVTALEHNQQPGESARLSVSEIAGAKLFFDGAKTQCLQCHNGPQLSNGGFHNIGTGSFSGSTRDFGRAIGLRAALMDEFNCVGPYSDADPDQCAEHRFMNKDSHIPLTGAFKVPTLRGLRHTAPYFHDGRFATLGEVLEYYNEPPDSAMVGPHELRALGLTSAELEQLEAFLMALSN